jgi:hypothetical protein
MKWYRNTSQGKKGARRECDATFNFLEGYESVELSLHWINFLQGRD